MSHMKGARLLRNLCRVKEGGGAGRKVGGRGGRDPGGRGEIALVIGDDDTTLFCSFVVQCWCACFVCIACMDICMFVQICQCMLKVRHVTRT